MTFVKNFGAKSLGAKSLGANSLVAAVMFCGVAVSAVAQPVTVESSRVVVVPPRLGSATTAPVQPLPPRPEQGSIYEPVTVFSLPVHTRAPVLAPYDNSSYRILGGQPETGGDALLAASMEDR
jgi:hypothetical protein